MYGAIIGDIVGSRFEFNNTHKKDFQLFHPDCDFTDDTVCTLAVAEWLIRDKRGESPNLGVIMQRWCKKYPNRGYGLMFSHWIYSPLPYNSFGNGAAMRVSPVGLFFKSLEPVLKYARASAIISHDHPEGIRGAQAVAFAVFLAKNKESKKLIKSGVISRFGYNLNQSTNVIRRENSFNETCQVTVPQAIVCFLESESFEDAIRLAVSIGGDSDTIAAITGSIAGAYWGIPNDLKYCASEIIDYDMLSTLNLFANEQE